MPNENLNKQAYVGTEAMATWTDHIGDFNYRVSGNITSLVTEILSHTSRDSATLGMNTGTLLKTAGEVFIGDIKLSDSSSLKKKSRIIQ